MRCWTARGGEQPHLEAPAYRCPGYSFHQWRVWGEELYRTFPMAARARIIVKLPEAVGKPQAARAVAQACAITVALIIPCHRVVREMATLAIRWGGN